MRNRHDLDDIVTQPVNNAIALKPPLAQFFSLILRTFGPSNGCRGIDSTSAITRSAKSGHNDLSRARYTRKSRRGRRPPAATRSGEPFREPSFGFLVLDPFAAVKLGQSFVNLLAKLEFRHDIRHGRIVRETPDHFDHGLFNRRDCSMAPSSSAISRTG